jgi:hypothetical protein
VLTEGQALLLLGAVFSIACGGSFFVRTYLCVRDVFPVAFIAGYASSGLVDDYVWRDPVPRSARREYVVSHLFGLTAVGLFTAMFIDRGEAEPTLAFGCLTGIGVTIVLFKCIKHRRRLLP